MKKGVLVVVLIGCFLGFTTHAFSQGKETLYVGVTTDFDSLDPVLMPFTTTGQMMQRLIFDGLIDFSPDGKIEPRLATSWKLVDDKTWRFNLRQGVKFHNGSPFTSADVKFSVEYFLDPVNKWNVRSYFNNFESIDIVDKYTVDVKTKSPDPVLLNLWAARIRIFSKDIFDKSGKEGLQRQAIGTGPFKFVSWQRKDRLVLEANADWYIAPPRIKGLVFRIIPETGARVAELQAGGVHIISNVPPFIVDQLNKSKETDVQVLPSLRVMYMILDTLSAPELKDKRVRQALNYAVDKDAIISGILRGMATPVGTHIPIRVPGVDQSIKPYPYNPEKAKSLLKEAGYPDGFALNLYSPTGRYSMDKEVTLSVADQLSKVGIKPNVNIMETSVYFSSLMNRTLKGIYFIGTTCGELDVNFSLALLSQGFVLNRYKDDALEDMVKKVGQIMKPDNRFEMARLIQKTIHDDAVFLYLYNEMLAYGFSTKVQGFEGRSDEMMDLWKVRVVE